MKQDGIEATGWILSVIQGPKGGEENGGMREWSKMESVKSMHD